MSHAFPIGKVLIGKVAPLGDSGRTSAIHKVPTNRRMRVTRIGFADDSQADLKHHGGEEKAIHQYPFDHYPGWREEVGAAKLLEQAARSGRTCRQTA